jgi:uncharacterized membrane protein YfcA
MLGLTLVGAVVSVVTVFFGAAIQGSIGIGLGLVAAPVLALADPDFIPGTIIIAVLPLTLIVAWGDRAFVVRRDVVIALLGRLPGVIAGAAVAAAVSDRVLAVLVGVSVLVAVGISLTEWRVPTTDRALIGAGAASGFTGTTTGVGGPPMALTYQHHDPTVMRATISAFFFVGATFSAAALWAAGEIGARQLELSALLVPAVVLGTVTARALRHHLRPGLVRPAVLVVCAASAVLLLADSLT